MNVKDKRQRKYQKDGGFPLKIFESWAGNVERSESHTLFTTQGKPKHVLKVAEVNEVKEKIQGAKCSEATAHQGFTASER